MIARSAAPTRVAGPVVYVLRYYPTLTETFVYREIDALRARGVEVHVLALGTRADGALQDEPPGVAVAHAPRGRRSLALLPPLAGLSAARTRAALAWIVRHQRPRDALRALWVAERARALGARRVHAHFAGEAAEHALVAAHILDVPLSVTVHAADLFAPRPSLPEILARAEVVTVAAHHAAWMADRYGVAARVVRCGVRLDVPRAAPGAPGPLRLVAVGRAAPKKGLDALVEAVRRHPDATLRLVCDAPAAWTHPRVTPGALPPSAVPSALAAANVFVLPCRVAPNGDRDGVPVALLEAMAAGLPVITTPVSGIPEVVDDAVGWLVPPDDPAALDAALAVASDPAARAARGAAARARIVERDLTLDAQADGLLAAWGCA